MKLYYFPGSCALAPHIVLEWLGAEFEPVRIEKGDPKYREINPLGVVPALEHDGRLYTQADAILHWLADSNPSAELGGGGSPDSKFELNEWMAFPFFNSQRYTTSEDPEQLKAVKAAAQARAGHYYEHLDRHLEGRDFLAGSRRSIADAYAIPMLRWGRLLERPFREYANLDRYLNRWEQDAGVRSALQTQGLLK
jgi:glutathione S-transferase